MEIINEFNDKGLYLVEIITSKVRGKKHQGAKHINRVEVQSRQKLIQTTDLT